jgi:hypothetical protein
MLCCNLYSQASNESSDSPDNMGVSIWKTKTLQTQPSQDEAATANNGGSKVARLSRGRLRRKAAPPSRFAHLEEHPVPHSTLVRGSLSASQHHVSLDPPALLSREDRIPHLFLTAGKVDEHEFWNPVLGVLVDRHSQFFEDPMHRQVIERGGVMFSFSCTDSPDPYEVELAMSVINRTCFDDEAKENYVPHVTKEKLSDYTVVIARSCYLLPEVDLQFVCDPALMSSVRYQTACEPAGTRIWEEGDELNSFRITKTVIPLIFSVTIQFRISVLKPDDIRELSSFLGIRVDGGLLLERTKRHKPPKIDRTVKAKSVLLYTKVPHGLFLSHLTVILQSSIPALVSRVVHRFGSMGLAEVLETAAKTRSYLEEHNMSSHSKASKKG